MRKLGKHKISVQRMGKKEKNSKEWRLISLYIGMVAGIVAYFSLVLNILTLVKVTEQIINIIGLIMAFIVLLLMFCIGNCKLLDKVHNKKSFENILEAFSLAGILGFSVEKVIKIFSVDNQTWGNLCRLYLQV